MDSEPPIPRRFDVIGTGVHAVSYDSAFERIVGLARSGRPAAVSACNTHIVTLARMDPSFGATMRGFDLIVPDGYPLIWKMNAAGAGLKDRVYGPYLMRTVLERTPKPWKHFFFGGTEDCLARLSDAAREMNPDIDIAGVFSPPFGKWDEAAESEFARRISASGADFIWVALGGGRQERWIEANLHRHARGVFFAVGDAFELLAGGRPFAPDWMQKRGLTWLYRLAQEPRRLFGRYFTFNSKFLLYSLRDAIFGPPSARDPAPPRKPKIAFLGSRGVPARYSGFETVVEGLGARLAERGYRVTVYNRFPRHDLPGKLYRGMRVVVLPTIPTKNLDTIVHTALSAAHAIFARYDIIYLCGVGNAAIGIFLRAAGMPVIINVDGADFRRSKWGSFARLWLRTGERLAATASDIIIADNREIVARYDREHGVKPEYLSYGTVIRDKPVECGELSRLGLAPKSYVLFVSRLTPENRADLLLRAYARYRGPHRLVICGAAAYEHAHMNELRALADERVIFAGGRYGDPYIELSQNSLLFVMPATIEATRLVLLDQMGMGATIVYNDCAATREVLGEAGAPFAGTEEALAAKLEELGSDPGRCASLGTAARARAKELYDWESVTDKYEILIAGLAGSQVGRKEE